MSHLYDNGINFGDDEYVAIPGEVPGLINEFRRHRVQLPEEVARARQYGISMNTRGSNNRNSLTYAEDRYGTQTISDMEDRLHDGAYYSSPANVNDPKYRYDEHTYAHEGIDGEYYPAFNKGCVRGRKKYREGIDAVPNLDKQSMSKWQPSHNEWGGNYRHQERFTPGVLATMNGQEMLVMLMLFIIVAVLINLTMKVSQLSKTIDMASLQTFTTKKLG